MRAITDEHFSRFCIVSLSPEDHDSNLMIDFGDANAFGKIPLPSPVDHHRFAVLAGDLPGQVLGLDRPALKENLAIELQIPDVGAILGVNVVEILGPGEIAVKGEIAGNPLLYDPIDQLTDEPVMIGEFDAALLAILPFEEAVELQRIVFAGGADVIDDDIVVGDIVPLLGVVPEVAGVLHEFAGMVHQDVIDGDDALGAVPGVRVLLQPVEPALIDGLLIPFGLREPAVQTGLVGGRGELPVDGRDVLLVGNHQAGEIFRQMPPLRRIGEKSPQFVQSLPDDAGKFHDSGHVRILPDSVTLPAIKIYRHWDHSESTFSILQKFSVY